MSANLPPEIWLDIFNWASCPLEGFSESYVPFEDSRFRANNVERARIRRTLGLVCRQWHVLSIQPLYTELNVHRDANLILDRLIDDVDGSGGGGYGGYGRLVRLVSLPYAITHTPAYGTDELRSSLEIIRNCPNISVLIRPPLTRQSGALRFEFSADSAPLELPSLKRLQWTHYSEAVRSGGINSIHDVLASSPSLQFLSIGGDVRIHDLRSAPITIPNLRTLHLRRMSTLGISQLCYWTLPALNTVVMTCTPPMLHMFWGKFGAQITTLELGMNMSFYMHDVLSRCIDACPALRTLNYHVFFTHPPTTPLLQGENSASTTTNTITTTSTRMIVSHITCIGLYPQCPFAGADDHMDRCMHEQHLESHVDWFMDKKRLPDLTHVRLYGSWAEAPISERFKEWARSHCLEFVDRPEQRKEW